MREKTKMPEKISMELMNPRRLGSQMLKDFTLHPKIWMYSGMLMEKF
jgi:hypothetical protein